MFAAFDKFNSTEFASGPRFGFLGEAPELKSLRIDCFFDCTPREVMGRSVVRPDCAGGGPGTMVLWKSAAREVAREGLQAFPRFRLENVNPHGLTLSAVDDGRRTCGPDRKSTRLNSSHLGISYAVFCLTKTK